MSNESSVEYYRSVIKKMPQAMRDLPANVAVSAMVRAYEHQRRKGKLPPGDIDDLSEGFDRACAQIPRLLRSYKPAKGDLGAYVFFCGCYLILTHCHKVRQERDYMVTGAIADTAHTDDVNGAVEVNESGDTVYVPVYESTPTGLDDPLYEVMLAEAGHEQFAIDKDVTAYANRADVDIKTAIRRLNALEE